MPEYQRLNCPNCWAELDPADPTHENGCIIGTLVGVIRDRGVRVTAVDVARLDADAFWNTWGGPAVDALADAMGVERY
jgi:hypothetical protein